MAAQRKHFSMRRVAQLDNNGCGIAAVATVCGATYAEAKQAAVARKHWGKDDHKIWIGEEQMLRAIRKLGYSAKPVGAFFSLRCPAIVTFHWYVSEFAPVHAVVWDPWAKRFIDPGPDHDFGISNARYTELWGRTSYRAIAVTGRIDA